MTRPILAGLLAVLAVLATGCALGSAPSANGRSLSPRQPDTLELVRMERYRGHGITFTYPAAWHRRAGFLSHMTAPVIDLSSQPTANPCRTHGCSFPVRRLRPGAVAVMWEQGAGLLARRPAVGVHVRVLRHGCRALGGGDELTALVVLGRERVYEAAACVRGPDVALHETEVRMMLASARPTRS